MSESDTRQSIQTRRHACLSPCYLANARTLSPTVKHCVKTAVHCSVLYQQKHVMLCAEREQDGRLKGAPVERKKRQGKAGEIVQSSE